MLTFGAAVVFLAAGWGALIFGKDRELGAFVCFGLAAACLCCGGGRA